MRKTSKTTWMISVNCKKILQHSLAFDDDDWSEILCQVEKSHCSAKEDREFQLS